MVYLRARFFRVGGVKPSVTLSSNRATLRQIIESHHAKNALVFGSVYRIHAEETALDPIGSEGVGYFI